MSARILVVEDEEPLGLLLRYNLEAEGYRVQVSTRGDDAELKLREEAPDLVLLDWMLPGLSGIELCRRIRQRRETVALPVIMLTARTDSMESWMSSSFTAPRLKRKPDWRKARSLPSDLSLATSASRRSSFR